MPDVLGTQPLDAMQMLLAQLGRIEKSIEALPSLLARLDALTESTRQLEQQWRETARELALRDDSQQRMIADLGLRQSELMAALAAVSGTVQEQKIYQMDVGRRVVALERQVESTLGADSQKKLEAYTAEFAAWRPWLGGMKWALTIAGGILVTLLVGAVLWALIQSGGGLP